MDIELLAPAGDMEKLKVALHFGADAVYAGGEYGLRAGDCSFNDAGLKEAVEYTHKAGKKIYVTVNIFARDADFAGIEKHLAYLYGIGADAAIVSDPGVIELAGQCAPRLPLHLSTQANTLNFRSAAYWYKKGIKRIVLARELSIEEIAAIHTSLESDCELEVFAHGALCISYSGRCLLSNYLSDGRDANRGECVQACRWEYLIAEKSRASSPLTLTEDKRGSYVMNSRDLNTLGRIPQLLSAGVCSFKIEGRMKTAYYCGTVVNAYRRAIDSAMRGEPAASELMREPFKINSRGYTEGLYFNKSANVCLTDSKKEGEYVFTAMVRGYDKDKKELIVEQRNRFFTGETLEILSDSVYFNRELTVGKMYDNEGSEVTDAKLVQQMLRIPCDYELHEFDMLRRRAI